MTVTHYRAQLRSAYFATDYQIWDGTAWLSARLGTAAPEIERLLERLDARTGAWITAWNPRSKPATSAENAASAAALASEIEARGLRALPHRGVGDDPAWTPEEGWFVLDLDRDAARLLAEAYGQNAIVWIERGSPPCLVETDWLLRDDG